MILLRYYLTNLLVLQQKLGYTFFRYQHGVINYFPHHLTTFLHHSTDNENCEPASSPISKPLYLYLSGSVFLVNFTAQTNQSPSLNFIFKSLDHIFNS